MVKPLFSENFTDWIAISSLAGSISIVILSKFNYWCVRASKRQAKAATEQACVALIAAERARDQAESARKSLEAILAEVKDFQKQTETRKTARRQSVTDRLLSISQNVRIWIAGMTEAPEGFPVDILPEDIEEILAQTMEHSPRLKGDVRLFHTRLEAADNTLRAFMEQPRALRVNALKLVTTLSNHLEQVAAMAENLAFCMETSEMPATWNAIAEEGASVPTKTPAEVTVMKRSA